MDIWVEHSLVDFPLASLATAIALCGTCHPQFDCALDPGFVFIPIDLDYFFDFELECEGLGETQSAKKQRTGDKAEYGGNPELAPLIARSIHAI